MRSRGTDDSRQSYDEWHAELPEGDPCSAPWHEMAMAALDRHRAVVEGGRVLEIGCGRGGFIQWLEESQIRPAFVLGSDFSFVAARRASSLVRSAAICVSDVQRLPVASGSIDCAVSLETIEHVSDPAHALKELARVIRTGGVLVLTTPNYLNATGLYRGYLRLRGRRYSEVGQPINRFTSVPRTLMWLHRARLTVTEFDGVGHYRLRPGRTPRRMESLDGMRYFSRWMARHTMFVARKP